MASIKAVIFDLDGTLYESRHFPLFLVAAHPFSMNILASERVSRRKLQGCYFSSAQQYYDELFKIIADKQHISTEKARKWFWQIYMPDMVKIIRRRYTARHHAEEAIKSLKEKGIKVTVLSDYGMVNEKLMACGLSPLMFDGVFEAPEVGGLKPCTQTFLNVCKAIGSKPEETLMIGDKVSTDGGAIAAGLPFIHLLKDEKKRGTSGQECTEMLWDGILSYLKTL